MLIPEGWKSTTLGETATLQRGFDLPVGQRNPGSVPVVASNGPVGFHEEAQVKGPGVVTGRSGTIGKVFFYEHDFWPLNTTLYVREFHGNDPRFIAVFLEALKLGRFVASTGVPSLNRNFVHPLLVIVPPLPEQRKIAAILSSVDATIEKTEAVIEQLQVVKKAMMQELLTRGVPGRHRRFKETEIGVVPEAWEIAALGSVFKLTSGKGIPIRHLPKLESDKANVPVYGGNGLAGFTTAALVEPPVVVVGRVGEYCGVVHLVKEPSWISDNALYTKEFVREADVGFLSELLRFIDLSKLRKRTGQPLVSQKPIHDLRVALPPVPEQRMIASMISGVSSRIEEEILVKDATTNTKRALMSVLLTGQLRVTPDDPTA